ncbi:hypothetical protein RchiOBHm_Chr5g0080981 [Rosa chinensis]|uniref:Uncharacterized protein n=1 Tax=Rosa chinensis TaxID=74649 RepID=A0A2P6QMY1_ROSCH|nr:hypothetical protein RchiOBHm_Chr5g0080981 [Rosa chinensis]
MGLLLLFLFCIKVFLHCSLTSSVYVLTLCIWLMQCVQLFGSATFLFSFWLLTA